MRWVSFRETIKRRVFIEEICLGKAKASLFVGKNSQFLLTFINSLQQ